MGILTKEVEVEIRPRNARHYESLGYNIPMKKSSKNYLKQTAKEFVYDFSTTIVVDVNDLPKNSNVKVEVLCDFCNEEISSSTYQNYCNKIDRFGNYACSKCRYNHLKIIFMEKYGVKSPAQLEEVRERMKKTTLERYGVENISQSSTIREKVNATLCNNHTQKTSKQQIYLHNFYGGEINFPIKYYAADICFPEENLVIEYDGGGHNLRVTLDILTQEEFDKKEIIRSKYIKSKGYKQMRIISLKDKLPSDCVLLKMLEDSRTYFTTYPNHSWITFSVDNNLVYNAEHKDGIPYNYGKLRNIA